MYLLSRILILFSAGLVLFACNPTSDPRVAESVDTRSEEVERLRDEIESGRQTVEDIQAFVEMEEAKLEENPQYTQEFLLDALHEQQKAKESIQENQARLKEITGEGE